MCNALGQRFRDVIRYLRDRELVYNEAQLASKMGISRQFLSDMKNGRKEISEQTVLKLCELFPVLSAEWLISGVGSMIVEPPFILLVVESVSIRGCLGGDPPASRQPGKKDTGGSAFIIDRVLFLAYKNSSSSGAGARRARSISLRDGLLIKVFYYD